MARLFQPRRKAERYLEPQANVTVPAAGLGFWLQHALLLLSCHNFLYESKLETPTIGLLRL